MLKKIAALLLVPVLLAGCSAAGDVETLLRAPQLSGESAALQKALNNYLGGSATLKYPASGDFLSPFAFGDWDGDGTDEAAVLYTTDTTSSNVWLAVLEPTGESSWRVSRVVEGLTSEVQSFSAAHLRDTSSQQLLAGYVSPQGDQYLVVYQYDGDTLSTVISKSYTDMIVADFTGKGDTQDLVLALPPDTELGGVTLQLLTANDGEFRSTQTLNLGEGVYSSCAALHAGTGSDDGMYLVMDAWTGTSSLVSDIILYDEATGFLQPYRPSGMSDIQRSTLRYHRELLSRDLDDNGTVDIPVEIDDGGTLQTPMDRPRILSLSCPLADTMIMPMSLSPRRIVSQRLKPSMPGSIISKSAASQCSPLCISSSARSALGASTTSQPAIFRFRATISRMLASSSTTKTRFINPISLSVSI